MRYKFVADSINTKKFCSRQTFFKRNAILDVLRFWTPPPFGKGVEEQRTVFILGLLESS